MKVKREATSNDSRSYYDNNFSMKKNLDKNGVFGSIFSTPASGRSVTTVHKINVQKKKLDSTAEKNLQSIIHISFLST